MDAHREFHEPMIEERYSALDGSGHAHLILLHQKFNQICFDIQIEKAIKQHAVLTIFCEIAQRVLVRTDARQFISQSFSKELFLFLLCESCIKILEIYLLENVWI